MHEGIALLLLICGTLIVFRQVLGFQGSDEVQMLFPHESKLRSNKQMVQL